ncbi:4'-phosphopantetheinyl transferase family protein [Polaromonas sp. YR568]|uniref:4'-phosphopantetheinyl transferase family protein n=1 Tax=Polaromonas sp. YR568 TaxID=1855301 RepID=UPI00398BD8EB
MSASTPGPIVSLKLDSVAAVHAGLSGLGLDWLSEAEQERLAAMTAPRRRTQFIAGRWLARRCLAARAGGRWQDYTLSAPDDGAPQVLAAPVPGHWYFSLSHSGDWLACAVSPQAVGVDVECSDRPRDFQALNEWMHEPDALQGGPVDPQEQQAWFYAQWTLKEAWLKQVSSAVPAPALRPSMRSARFIPRKDGDDAAMVGRGEAFTIAVYPATPATLRWEEAGALGQAQWGSWEHAGIAA